MRRVLILVSVAALLAVMAVPAMAAKPAPETVTVIGPFGGPQADAFVAELESSVSGNRVEIVYEAYEDLELEARVAGPNPPDLIIAPSPDRIVGLASELVDLGDFVNTKSLRRDFGDHLIDVASVDGAVLGVPIDLSLKSLVWYKPAVFAAAGYAIPETFDELVALSDQMVTDGHVPWCNNIESGFATGWVGTDWVEDLLLGAEGPGVYDQWVDHTVLFEDPRVETAFERFQQMIDSPDYVFDRAGMLTSPLPPINGFFTNAPALDAEDCLMHKQGSFFGSILEVFGADVAEFSTFRFPSVAEAYDESAMGGATYVAVLNERKEVRELTRLMVSQRFGREALAESGEWILPNVRFDNDRYTDELTRSWADIVQAAVAVDQFRFDGSDLMPPVVGQGTFWAGIVDLVAGTKTIPQVLADIDASWPS